MHGKFLFTRISGRDPEAPLVQVVVRYSRGCRDRSACVNAPRKNTWLAKLPGKRRGSRVRLVAYGPGVSKLWGEAAVSRAWQGASRGDAIFAAVLAAFGAKAVIVYSVFEADGCPCVCVPSQNGSGDNVCVDTLGRFARSLAFE